MKIKNNLCEDLLRYGEIVSDYDFIQDNNFIRIKRIFYNNSYYVVIMNNGIINSVSTEILNKEDYKQWENKVG